MGKLNKKITKLIGIGIVLVVIAGSSYFIYKKFFNKCLTVVCPADSGVCFTLSDQELKNLKQNTLDLFKEKKMKYLKNVKVQTNRIKDLNHLNTKPYINNPRVHGEYSKKYCKQIPQQIIESNNYLELLNETKNTFEKEKQNWEKEKQELCKQVTILLDKVGDTNIQNNIIP